MSNKIITISREFGSGGRELGRRLAEELGYEYYDKEIIAEISKRTELSEEYVKEVVEHNPHNLFPITVGQTFSYLDGYTMKYTQAIYREQSNVIKELAQKSNCVIVGRCADFILKEFNPFKIFVYADIKSRLERCKKRGNSEHLPDKKYIKKIKTIDKSRGKYYYFFTDKKWEDRLNYDLCINTTDVDIKAIVPVVAKLFK